MRQHVGVCTATDGTRIAHATHGRGRPLVLAGHWATHLERDWDGPLWRHWLEALGDRHRVTRYDERDTGLSERDVHEVSLDAWVRDLETVVDTVGLDRFPLVGMDTGGPVAVAYAHRHPGRVSALVLVGTFAVGRAVRSPPRRGEAEALATLLRFSWDEENPAIRQMWSARLAPDADPEQLSWLNEQQRQTANARGAERSYRTAVTLDVSRQVRELDLPTLVLHARGDTFVPFDSGRELAATVPRSQFVPLDSRNHILLPDEPAWTQLLAALDEFLTPSGAPSSGPPSVRLPALTSRQHEVLDMVAAGLDNPQIAERLVLSPKTVRNHVSAVFDRLGVSNRGQAIVLGREAGLGGGRATGSSTST